MKLRNPTPVQFPRLSLLVLGISGAHTAPTMSGGFRTHPSKITSHAHEKRCQVPFIPSCTHRHEVFFINIYFLFKELPVAMFKGDLQATDLLNFSLSENGFVLFLQRHRHWIVELSRLTVLFFQHFLSER